MHLSAGTTTRPLVIVAADTADVGRCEVCGCTEDRACPGGCWWVSPGLCSTCAGEPDPDPLIGEASAIVAAWWSGA